MDRVRLRTSHLRGADVPIARSARTHDNVLHERDRGDQRVLLLRTDASCAVRHTNRVWRKRSAPARVPVPHPVVGCGGRGVAHRSRAHRASMERGGDAFVIQSCRAARSAALFLFPIY